MLGIEFYQQNPDTRGELLSSKFNVVVLGTTVSMQRLGEKIFAATVPLRGQPWVWSISFYP